MATQEGHLDTVKQLKALNCDINACNGVSYMLSPRLCANCVAKISFSQHCLQNGLTAVDLALQGNSDAMVEALLD